MVQPPKQSQERKDLPFLTKFLPHIMKPGAAFAVTWYGVSYILLFVFLFYWKVCTVICIMIYYYYYSFDFY